MSLYNMQISEQQINPLHNSTVCQAGTGNACTGDLIARKTFDYSVSGSYLPVSNCGTRIFSHGTVT